VEAVDDGVRCALRLEMSMTMHRGDHDLVGDRIEELPSFDTVPCARAR
jgi:hypothetical protein